MHSQTEGNFIMKEDNQAAITEFSPDLFVPPHVLPVLMELFAGEVQKAFEQQEQLLAHLVACHYCRTAVVTLLGLVQEYDRRNNAVDEVAHNLLVRFADISHEIETSEAHAYERLGAYAEAIVAEGQDKAERRFPDVAVHIKLCPDCRSAVEATVADIIEAEEIG